MKSVDEKKPLPPVKLLQEIISAFIVLSSVLFLLESSLLMNSARLFAKVEATYAS